MAQYPSNFVNFDHFIMDHNNQNNAPQGRIGPQTQSIDNFGDFRNGQTTRDIGVPVGFGDGRNKLMQQNQTAPFSTLNYYPPPFNANNNNNNNNWFGTKADNSNCFGMQPAMQPAPTQNYNTLPMNVLDQIRNCPMTSSPIFILPNGAVTNNNPLQTPTQPQSCVTPMPTCVPYTIPLPIFQPFDPRGSRDNECKCAGNTSNKLKNKLLEVCEQLERGEESMPDYNNNCWMENKINNKNTELCAKKNCNASIQLQAMIAQLLGIQGLMACAVTRLLLKKIPGAQINESVEEIMERSSRCLKQMSKADLIKESKCGQDVQRLFSLYLTSPATPLTIIPTLTTAQIKSNILKAQIESAINARIMEDQGCGMEAPEPLDNLLLELKSDCELRQLLAALREKECEERVNLNFAAYSSQKFIAESRLNNVQLKICQVEKELDRRRNINCNTYTNARINTVKYPDTYCPLDIPDKGTCTANVCVSPNVCASPKKLLLKPHVGSPETTYSNSIEPNTKSLTDCTKNSGESATQTETPTQAEKKTCPLPKVNAPDTKSKCPGKKSAEPNKNKKEKKKIDYDSCADDSVTSDCECQDSDFLSDGK